MAKVTPDERREAIRDLRRTLRPGATVYTILRHVSRSGMSQSISVVIVRKGEARDISWLVRRAMGYSFDHDNYGLKVTGCGMDMGFHLVYGLGRTLYPRGFNCPGAKCQGNGHSNTYPAKERGSMKHTDGGYAFRHQWL